MNTLSLTSYLSPLPLIAVLRGITPPEVTAIAAALIDNGFRSNLYQPGGAPDAVRAAAAAYAAGFAALEPRR